MTQIVTWNRGTPDSAGATHTMNQVERLLPDGWIAGWAPAGQQAIDAGKTFVQTDAVGADMNAPGALGSMRILSDHGADTFIWSRVSVPAAGGGTLGAATNAALGTAAISAGDTGFLFAPADAAFRTHAGVLVVTDAKGTISIVDAAGQTRASFPFDWPSGYRVQGTSIFDAFGMATLPSARVVCSVKTGSVLLFGTAYDPVSGDAVRLEQFRSGDVGLWPTLPGFVRGNGYTGTLQVFNPGTTSAHVGSPFRAAPAPARPRSGTADRDGDRTRGRRRYGRPLRAGRPGGARPLVGPDRRVLRDVPSARGGRTAGFWRRGRRGSRRPTPGSRGVFLSATANDAFTSTLQLVNAGFDPASVTVTFTAADGTAAGTQAVSLAPLAVVNLPAWPSGQTTDMGRVDVTPADGSAPVLALLARRDRVSQDTDAIFPFVVPK